MPLLNATYGRLKKPVSFRMPVFHFLHFRNLLPGFHKHKVHASEPEQPFPIVLQKYRKIKRTGADAVYMGASSHGARQQASNSISDIRGVVEYAHRFGVKVYVTVNTIIYDEELAGVEKLVWELYGIGVGVGRNNTVECTAISRHNVLYISGIFQPTFYFKRAYTGLKHIRQVIQPVHILQG